MGHNIKAIIGKREDVQKLADELFRAKMIGLPQNFGMIMLTEKLYEDMEVLSGDFFRDDPCSELEGFDKTVAWILERYSPHTKLAYIETDYFGGVGTQGGVLYSDGRELMSARVGEGTINALLKELGALEKPNMDVFNCLELGHYRYMDEYQ